MKPTDWRADLATWTDDERGDWSERAAILEYLAGLPRSTAERLAYSYERARRSEELQSVRGDTI